MTPPAILLVERITPYGTEDEGPGVIAWESNTIATTVPPSALRTSVAANT
ncbi:MAG: hypothetical protein ACTHZ9_08980 [Leucobacter sp.]